VMKYASALWNPSEFFITGLVTVGHIMAHLWAALTYMLEYSFILLISLMRISKNQRHILVSILVAISVQAFLPVIYFKFRNVEAEVDDIPSTTSIASILAETRITSGLDIRAVPSRGEAST
jgi:hypothetical protein